jgi:choline kinase
LTLSILREILSTVYRVTMPRIIILAAGSGRRLLPYTVTCPKPLVEVAGQPLVVRLVQQFIRAGISQYTVVLGDRGDQIKAALLEIDGASYRFVLNGEYETTNNAYSLWLCRDDLRAGCILAEADVIADQSVIDAVVAAPSPTIWAVRTFEVGMDGALLTGEEGGPVRGVQILRHVAQPPPGFKSTGLLKLAPTYGARLAEWLDAEVAQRRDRYYDLVVADHLADAAPHLWLVNQGSWLEIDTPEDLSQAEALFGAEERA